MCTSISLCQTMYYLYRHHLLGLPLSRDFLSSFPQRDLRKLREYNYLYGDHNLRVQITDLGLEFVGDIISRPEVTVNIAEFRDEAISGITKDGKESKIRNACLPTSEYHEPSHCPDLDQYVEMSKIIDQIADRMDIDREKVIEQALDGRVAWCPGCRSYSLFRKNAKSSTGIDSVCRSCRNL
jgi:hypothetical protein